MQPRGASSAYGSYCGSLWMINSSTWAAIDPPTGTLLVYVGGLATTATFSPALNWNTLDTLDIFVGAGGSAATVVKIRINDGAVLTPTFSGTTTLGTVSTSGSLQLFSYSAGYQFTSYVQRFTVWHTGHVPAWTL